MFRLEVEGGFVDDLEELTFVVTLTEGPELLKQFHSEQVLTGQDLEDLVGPLDELEMGLLGVPQDGEHLLLAHPLDQLLHRECLGTVELVVTDNSVELLNSKNPALKQGRR